MRTYDTVVAGLVASLSLLGAASAASIEVRQSCPQIHVFGARETTVSQGYGSAAGLVNAILSAFPGATSEAIVYPACGGQASCGGIAYGDSVRAGTQAVATAINNFNQRCPNTKIAVVGYSQGGQIFDNGFCGGADSGAGITNSGSPLTASAHAAVQAVILYGNPRYRAGLPYNVGTCTAQGFAARPAGFTCANNGGSRVKNYCDAPDPYCCTGNNQAVHQGYQGVYGQQALAFVRERLNAGGNPPATTVPPPGTTVTPPPTNTPSPSCSGLWGQCGGQGWTGPTCCSQGTCRAQNAWYSQCLN